MKWTFGGFCRKGAAFAILFALLSSAAHASIISKLPGGANHEAAHAGTHRSQGMGVAIGVLEPGPRPASNNLGGRLMGQYRFGGRTPNNPAPGDLSGMVTPFIGTSSTHMALVADTAAGGPNGGHIGVAPAATVYTGSLGFSSPGPATEPERDGDDAIHNENFDTFRAAVKWMYEPLGAPANAAFVHPRIALYNNSWGAAFEVNDSGDNRFARFVDHFAATRDVLFVGAAGNNADNLLAPPGGPEKINFPWDAFNAITVGATQAVGGDFTTRVGWSEYLLDGDNGAAPDFRGKPDVLAPGVGIGSNQPNPMGGVLTSSGTSFAAPHVTGIAALLAAGTELTGTDPVKYPSLALGSAGSSNHLAIKSIILNSARKQNINGPFNGKSVALDYSGGINSSYDLNGDGNATNDPLLRTDQQPSDGNYLNGATLRAGVPNSGALPVGQRTANWTPSNWSTDAMGRKLIVSGPLDDEQGTGLADAKRALVQYDGGRQFEKFFNPGGISAVGWNTSAISPAFGEDVYAFNKPIAKGTFITATLTWDRIVEEINGAGGSLGVIDDADTYSSGIVPDFDLFIYKKLPGGMFERLAESISPSAAGNVEHLHFPVPEAGLAFDYELRVDLLGAGNVFRDYALSWWTTTVPEPATGLLLAMAIGVGLRRRRRPADLR
ncbi:MAG TPA: S8 family serine peptidase [Lacipirellulaceae bacterium]|nr:S8 family serine peptidase [Lacipirellulaceae bacterium]